jgi:DNA-binding response OmpR family regulator
MTPPLASRVLIIEDEAMLRSSMARSLGRVSNVEVLTAATLGEGLGVIDATPPALILSDIDLPDRSGLELIGELGRRNLRLPIVFISAYLTAYRAQIPRHANIEVLEKPVGIEELREVVRRHLSVVSSPSGLTPFGVADYLQLAGMGRHSVIIEVHGRGTIVVKDGVLWSSKDAQGEGEEAFYRLALLHADVTCQALQDDPGPRTMKGGAEELLLEAARRSDEAASKGGPTTDEFGGFTELELEDPTTRAEAASAADVAGASSGPVVSEGRAATPAPSYEPRPSQVAASAGPVGSEARTPAPAPRSSPAFEPRPASPTSTPAPRSSPVSEPRPSEFRSTPSSSSRPPPYETRSSPAPRSGPSPVPAPVAPPPRLTPTESPAARPPDDEFDALWDRGVEALLARHYDEALIAFDRCNQLRPDDRRVLANLSRLQTLLKEREGHS